MGRGQRHTTDVVPDHCSPQATLWTYCVWHSTPYQFTTTWQHPQRWTKTGTRSILHQPSFQYVHRGQRSSSGGTSVEAVHELLSENSCCTNYPAHPALHEFGPTTRDLYLSKPNRKGGMTRPPNQPIGLKVEKALTSAEIDAEMVCPLKIPSFPPGTHEYNPKRHSLIEGVSKCMITSEEARTKFNEYHKALGQHDEVYTDVSKINERVGAAAVINRHFQNGETTCCPAVQKTPKLQHHLCCWGYGHHRGTGLLSVYGSCTARCCGLLWLIVLQAIESEDTENPLICHIMNLLWALSDKGTHVRFCWVPSHCGIEGNERVDQLAKETLDHDIDPLTTVHYADLKPVVNSYIQQEVQIKWDVSTVFFKTRGHLLVWAPPRLASSGLAWPCLAMPCHALSCLAWVWMWRFFVQYKKWDSYGGVVLMRFSRYLQSDYSRLITIWAKCIYILIFCAKTSFYKRYLLMAWYLVYPMIRGYFQIARLMPGKYGGHFADDIFKLILFIKNVV